VFKFCSAFYSLTTDSMPELDARFYPVAADSTDSNAGLL